MSNPLLPFPKSIRLARHVAVLLDSAITLPIIRKRIGLDPLLGLFPGSGDLVGLALSGYIVGTALYHELPLPVVGRMGLNLLIDTVLGAVPVLGDLFDFKWKANLKNIELLEFHFLQLQGSLITLDLDPQDYTVLPMEPKVSR